MKKKLKKSQKLLIQTKFWKKKENEKAKSNELIDDETFLTTEISTIWSLEN